MFLSRDGDVRYYSPFSVLHDRFVQDDCHFDTFYNRIVRFTVAFLICNFMVYYQLQSLTPYIR